MKDAFDQWWQWANKDRETDFSTIPAWMHEAVMALSPEQRHDRDIVNAAVIHAAESPPDAKEPPQSEDHDG